MIKTVEFRNGILIGLFYTIVYLLLSSFDVAQAYKYFSICVYIQFIYTIVSWHRITKCWIDSYLIFAIALYVFTLGHAFLDPFDAVAEKYNLIISWGIKETQYIYAEYISLVFILSFHLGAIAGKVNTNNRSTDTIKEYEVKALRKVGTRGTLFTLPFYLYSIVSKIKIYLLYGYMGLYDNAYIDYGGFSAIVRLIADLYVPSIICLLVYGEVSQKNRLVIYLFSFITVCIPPFFIGARTNSVIMCGIMFLIYNIYHKISMKQVLVTLSIVYVMLLSLVLIRYSRQMQEVNDIVDVVEKIEGTEDSNPLLSMVSEMGWSMYPLVKTIEIKESPHEHFLYGSTIIWGMTAVFPNLFWNIHPARKNADMSNWITQKLGLHFGVGYSLVAEAYVNFGVFGFIFMYLLSSLFIRLFKYSSPNNKSNAILQACSLIFLWFIVRIVRNNFLDTFRYLVFFVLPFYLLLRYYSNRCKNCNP